MIDIDQVQGVDQVGFPILSVLVFLPLVVGAILAFARSQRAVAVIAIGGAGATAALAGFVALRFTSGVPDTQFVERSRAVFGVSWHLGVDGVNVLFVPLTALLGLLVIVYAHASGERDTRQYAVAILALESSMLGAFVALDLVVFWLFFVIELVPSWFLITRWGTGTERRRAAGEYVGYMAVGSLLMLAGIIMLGRNFATATGQGQSFALHRLLEVDVPVDSQTLVFFLLVLGFAVKVPIFPFHTWLPKVLENGPIVGMSVFLVGVKLGAYGLLRFVIPLLPDASTEWLWLMVVLGSVGTAYGALLALGQSNLRRMLAFASLSHVGVVVIGLFSLNLDGFEGGLLQMVNLGIVGIGLFFIAGFLSTRVGPPDLGSLGGLIHHAPLMAGSFLIVALAGVGLPGTNGFNGEHLVVLGGYQRHWVLAVSAGLGVFLTAAYSLSWFQRGFMGEARPAVVDRVYDLTRSERGIVAALAVLIFWIGLGTGPFIQAMRPSLRELSDHVETSVEGNGPDEAVDEGVSGP